MQNKKQSESYLISFSFILYLLSSETTILIIIQMYINDWQLAWMLSNCCAGGPMFQFRLRHDG